MTKKSFDTKHTVSRYGVICRRCEAAFWDAVSKSRALVPEDDVDAKKTTNSSNTDRREQNEVGVCNLPPPGTSCSLAKSSAC